MKSSQRYFALGVSVGGLVFVIAAFRPALRNLALNSGAVLNGARGSGELQFAPTVASFVAGGALLGLGAHNSGWLLPDAYKDAVCSNGTDAAAGNLDAATVFFYSGHGWPRGWEASGGDATQRCIRLGNRLQDGSYVGVRYLLQCSCQVYAHGPFLRRDNKRPCGSAPAYDCDYSAPGLFVDHGNDTQKMANAFVRWDSSLGIGTRFACGGSSDVKCSPEVAKAFWRAYRDGLLDVSDAFLMALYNNKQWVPLCIARGGPTAADSPLAEDRTILDAQNEWRDRLYIEYIVASEALWPGLIDVDPRTVFPAYAPRADEGVVLSSAATLNVIDGAVEPTTPTTPFWQSKQGVFYFHHLAERRPPRPIAEVPDEEVYRERAVAFWTANFSGLPRSALRQQEPLGQMDFRLAGHVRHASSEEWLKNRVVMLRRSITLENEEGSSFEVPQLDGGGYALVQLNADDRPGVINASVDWRLTRFPVVSEARGWEEAEKEAFKQLGDLHKLRYRMFERTWGYRQVAEDEETSVLRPYYRFILRPRPWYAEGRPTPAEVWVPVDANEGV